ncbi:MAG: hypothetical protein AB1505_31590 [Candidatus Latescibacterota bacterium]
MKVLLDTNVPVSAAATRGLCSDVLREVLANHELLLSDQILAALRRTLRAKLGVRRTLVADLLPAYLLSGGSPVAGAELAAAGRIPEFVIEMTRDWIYGEFAASGRQRSSLLGVMECLHRFGGTSAGQARLAREAGLANNTVAAGYVEQLMDLLCVATAFPWDEARGRANRRRPGKLHFVILLVAVAWLPARIRCVHEYHALPEQDQARMLEWLVAQEIWRRAALRGEETPEVMHFWQAKEHELDLVLPPHRFVEVKRGKASPVEFAWWARSFPKGQLTVVNAAAFRAERMVGMTAEEFLGEDWGPPSVDALRVGVVDRLTQGGRADEPAPFGGRRSRQTASGSQTGLLLDSGWSSRKRRKSGVCCF